MKVRGLRKLKLSRVDLVPVGANPGAHIALYKQEGDSPGSLSDENPNVEVEVNTPPVEEQPMSQTPEQIAALAAKDAELLEAKTELEKAKAELTEKETALAKAKDEAPESIRKELDEAREELATIQKEQRRVEFVTKAKDYERLGDVEKIGSLLEAADERFTDEHKTQLEGLLKGAAELLKGAAEQGEKGALFAQFADSGSDQPASLKDRLAQAARDRVAKGDFDTVEKAKAAIMREDVDIQREYEAESVRS